VRPTHRENPKENPYEVLDIEKGASAGEIKRAYLRLIRKYTPEQHPEEFRRIRAAYEQLKDERARAETDVFHLNLDEEALARMFDRPVGEIKLDPVDEMRRVIGWIGDLSRTDFSHDLTRMPWEKVEDAGLVSTNATGLRSYNDNERKPSDQEG